MTYCVVEKPCPDCETQGFQRFKGPGSFFFDVNCGRCFATGWLEEYRFTDGDEGSNCPVEIPNPPDTQGAGGRHLNNRVPVGAF
jgi:hypothetical protein